MSSVQGILRSWSATPSGYDDFACRISSKVRWPFTRLTLALQALCRVPVVIFVAVVFGVVSVADEFFGVPVVVGAGLAAVEVWGWDPFTAALPTKYLRKSPRYQQVSRPRPYCRFVLYI